MSEGKSVVLSSHLLLRGTLSIKGLFSKTFCYFTLIQERKTWSEARSYCKSYHTDLATIQSDEDRYKIQEIANAISFSHRAWMGLYDGVLAWRWSYRDLNIDYMNWASGEDTSSRTQRKCGVITVTGSWHVASCEEQKPSFCYNGKSLEGSFVFIDALLTWRDAQLYCRRKHVDLAIISDASENSALLQLFPPKPSQPEAWIGLSKNLWLWSDQSKVSWTSFKWAEGEPDNAKGNEKCGFVRQTGLIGDEDCSHQLPFYCSEFNFCFNS
ncbi:macrophage mannose receptor 1-like [Carassius gibelio]|uniref:macrophage mannose receptor 1-like n=1 Tax=Carassius gibelio TaxID=101364 RepID=UPI002278C790|nr:macrophage mannose receptor 1-like [Carassius gibelio]